MAKIVFVGNCQIQSVCNAYNTFVSPWTADVGTFVDAYKFKPGVVAATIQDADVIVGQVAEFEPELDIDAVPTRAAKLRIPVVCGGFLWPFAGVQPHPKSESRRYMPLGPYPRELGDTYLNRLINRAVDPDEIVRKYLMLDVHKLVNLDRLLELNLEKQRNRDRATGFNTAEIIEKYFRDEHIFLTPYHPNLRVARYLIQETFRKMDVDEAAIERVGKRLSEAPPFPKEAAPIHPSVVRHFGLKYGDQDYRYRYFSEGTFTFEQYIRRYVRFEWNEPLEEGMALGREKKFEAAVEMLALGLRRSPSSTNGFIALSSVLEKLGRIDEALGAARKAVDLEPDNASAVRQLGVLLMHMEHLEEAERSLRRAVKLSLGAPHFLMALSHVLHRRKQSNEAVALARQAIEMDPIKAGFHAHLAAMLESNGEIAEAERSLRRAIDFAPNTAHPYTSLSRLLTRQNQLDEAIVEARKAVDLEPDKPDVLARLGHLLNRQEQYLEAEVVLRQAIKLSPETARFYHELSHVLLRQARHHEAVMLLQQFIADGRRDSSSHARLGQLMTQSGDLGTAESEFRIAVDLAPHVVDYRTSLADVLNRLGRRDEAVQVLREAIAQGTTHAHVHGLLAHILAQADDLEGAEREFRVVIQRSGNSSSFRSQLADVLKRQGRADEAARLQ